MRKYRKAVFIIAYRKERKKILYLILKRKLHWKGYEFPKGGLESNETPMMAVMRELFEETGLKVVKIKKFKLEGKYNYAKGWQGHPGFIGQSWQLFSAEVKGKKVKYDKKEHAGYKWMDFNNAIRIIDFKEKKDCLKAVNSYLLKSKNRIKLIKF